MNSQEYAALIWHNGNILQKEKIFSTLDFNFLYSSNVVEYFFTSGTNILFFNETFSKIQSQLKLYYVDSILLSDGTGEIFKNEIKRLLIRNRCYKTTRCYILFSISHENRTLNEYVFIVPDPELFNIDKIIKKTIVSSLYPKPKGNIITYPTIENEFRKIIKTEIENVKADDCIIIDCDQNIIESYLGNIFLIGDEVVLTPSLSSGFYPHILRNISILHFEKLGHRVVERNDIQTEDLLNANEVIIAGETGIYSLKGIEYKRYFDNVRKSLISSIIANLAD